MIGRKDRHQASAEAWNIASALLRYPDESLVAALPAIKQSALDQRIPCALKVAELIESWQAMSSLGRGLIELQEEYVAVFDLSRSTSLYMTWHQYGDRRQRGLVLLKLKRLYEEHGMAPVEDELPDWLPLMLQFAAAAPPPAGSDLLENWRAALELVRKALHDQDRPQAVLLDVISATLPKIGPNVQKVVEKLLAEGPPEEEVGLEPFGPGNEMPAAEFPTIPQFAPTGGLARDE